MNIELNDFSIILLNVRKLRFFITVRSNEKTPTRDSHFKSFFLSFVTAVHS